MTVRFWIAVAVKPQFRRADRAQNRVLTGAKGHECRLLLGLVEKTKNTFVKSTRLVHSHHVAGQRVTRLQHPATDLLARCARIRSVTVRGAVPRRGRERQASSVPWWWGMVGPWPQRQAATHALIVVERVSEHVRKVVVRSAGPLGLLGRALAFSLTPSSSRSIVARRTFSCLDCVWGLTRTGSRRSRARHRRRVALPSSGHRPAIARPSPAVAVPSPCRRRAREKRSVLFPALGNRTDHFAGAGADRATGASRKPQSRPAGAAHHRTALRIRHTHPAG
jgi:hypothetical protein